MTEMSIATMRVTRIRDWATGYTRLGRNEAVVVRHDNGRAVRFEFDSDESFIYVYTYRWLSCGYIRETSDPVRRFRRSAPTSPEERTCHE